MSLKIEEKNFEALSLSYIFAFSECAFVHFIIHLQICKCTFLLFQNVLYQTKV